MRKDLLISKVSLALESYNVSNEGLGDWLSKKLITKPTVSKGPIKVAVNGKESIELIGDLVSEVKRVILNNSSLDKLKPVTTQVTLKGVLNKLGYQNKSLNDEARLAVLKEGFSKTIGYLSDLYDKLDRHNQVIQKLHKSLIAVSEDDAGERLESVVMELQDLQDPAAKLSFPYRVLGNYTITRGKPLEIDKEPTKDVSVRPLSKEECVEVAKLIISLEKPLETLSKQAPSWLDYEDGDEVWTKLRIADESEYFTYTELTYFVNLNDLYLSDISHDFLFERIVALVEWINHSLKE